MLNLVEALRSEAYTNSPLTEFLLERAINNKQFGKYFFWYLRSEFDEPKSKNRFSVILEIFLKNSRSQVQCLIKQKKCLDRFYKIREKLTEKQPRDSNHFLLSCLNEKKEVFADFHNPINFFEKSKGIRADKCKVYKSKTKPLGIVCENIDQFGSDINFIFKSGDDLRQDIFTLQILRVMDMIWKSFNMDFQMTNYICLNTGPKMGVIEKIEGETIASIQRKSGLVGAFKSVLLDWLKEKNKDNAEDLKMAIKNFTDSAIGYCVATYILGVADRHSDNIMIKKNGQMFHIDFGHILGHFKQKFGIKRENVPFILTHDFIDIINKGEKNKTTKNFTTFKNMCYMVGP